MSYENQSATFKDNETRFYALHVSGYSGDAGDALEYGLSNSSTYMNDMYFSTYDANHINHVSSCPLVVGGFWFNLCRKCSLNGPYTAKFYWATLAGVPGANVNNTLTINRMMIKCIKPIRSLC